MFKEMKIDFKEELQYLKKMIEEYESTKERLW